MSAVWDGIEFPVFPLLLPAVIEEVLSNHVPGCHLLDRLLLLPDGVVGSPGVLTPQDHNFSCTVFIYSMYLVLL